MGLVYNLFIGIIHLIIFVIDIAILLVILRILQDHFQWAWLKQINGITLPLTNQITATTRNLAMKITGKIYPERTMLMVFIICLLFIKLILGGL